MDEAAAERLVHDRLLGPDSVPLQIRGGDFVNEAEIEELFRALEVLAGFYRERPSVPKMLALALVDISAQFDNRFYSASQRERLEDIGMELHRLAEELFVSGSGE